MKTWKKPIKKNFQGQKVSYGRYCNASGMLKVDSVYTQG